jgi:hypothetical protein
MHQSKVIAICFFLSLLSCTVQGTGVEAVTDFGEAPDSVDSLFDALELSEVSAPDGEAIDRLDVSRVRDAENRVDTRVIADTEDTVDTGPLEPPEPAILPEGLVGSAANQTYPPEPVGVVTQDGESVLSSQLVGHWTVLWFYPFASTFG